MIARLHIQRGFLIACALALLSACKPASQAGGTTSMLALPTADGWNIAATLYPAGPGSPGMVLVHMLGADRSDWTDLAIKLQARGITCLAIDLRGHGDSTRSDGTRVSARSFTTQDWLGALLDIEAAMKALVEHGADPNNLGIAGASIGANLALQYAAAHRDVQALVLLSPGLDYRGVTTKQALGAYAPRPLLLMAAESDSYAAQSCRELEAAAPPSLAELRVFAGAAHGTDILAAASGAAPLIEQWLELVLGLQPTQPQ